MADIRAINAVGDFMIGYLGSSYQRLPSDSLLRQTQCQFQLLSTGKLATVDEDDLNTSLSLLLHRVTINEHVRNATRANRVGDRSLPLSLDLHYLMTVWAPEALAENLILAWAMQQMHQHPVLDGALLPDANWGSGEVIQIIPADLSTEDIMRIWDSFKPSYRLSVAYIARVVRIDVEPLPDQIPVVASRFVVSDVR
jgi:hypothetical protein